MLSIDELKQLKVGDTVFIATDIKSMSGNYTIEKTGRKYLYLNCRKVIDLGSGMTKSDSRGMSFNVWKDESTYVEACRRYGFTQKIKKMVRDTNLSYDQALKIDAVLRGE